jgi:hypothetical protein
MFHPGRPEDGRIARPLVDSRRIFHRRYESAVRFERYDPALLAVGLDNVFFSTRPIVLSLARSTICSSTTLFLNNRKVQRARPSGGAEHAKAISSASVSPSKIGATGGVSRVSRRNTASNPSTCAQFADATRGFLREKVPRNRADVCDSVTSLTTNFRVISPKDFWGYRVNGVDLLSYPADCTENEAEPVQLYPDSYFGRERRVRHSDDHFGSRRNRSTIHTK